jgi:TRAP-type mannitol/chloroaromatic compound transport system permease small subunit
LERFIAAMDGLNERIGALASAMTFGTAFLCFATVFLRDALNTSYTWLVEAYIWQHMLVILLGAGDTFQNGGFVRVDLFYARMSQRGRAVVDLLG